jgi:hypothetical protein
MPRSGIANGCADFVLPVRDLAKRDFRAKPRRCDLWPAAAHQHCRDTLKSRLITSRRPGAWTAGDPDRRRSGGSGSPLKGGAQRRNCVTRPLQVGWLSSRPAPRLCASSRSNIFQPLPGRLRKRVNAIGEDSVHSGHYEGAASALNVADQFFGHTGFARMNVGTARIARTLAPCHP